MASSFGTSANNPSSSAFGGNAPGSPFGSAFSSSQPQIRPPAPVAQTSSNPPATATAAITAPTAPTAPKSSFSNFLRKDRTGTSTPVEASDAMKGTEDEDELRKKRFEDAPKQGNRFLEMKGGREALRNAYIKSGVLPDPDKPTDLALAVKLVGTCQDMCPEFEREEREFQKELDPLELYPGTDRVDPRIAVKIYRRPAAGRELPLPEDVRPPPVLKRTLDYLFHDLLPADPNDPRFTSVQGFLWNRTRAVRQDFIVQSEGGAIAIECHERIARYHILCLHWRGGPGAEGWSEQQELEQLRKTMRSLIEFYDDNRRKASASNSGNAGHQTSPNEAEFRAYNLLLHLRDPETLREAELLPGDIFRSPLVQTAINLRQLAQQSNNLEKRGQPRNTEATLNFFSKFFAELRKPNVNYLMACLAENSFSSIRIGAVKAMSKAYMAQHRALPIERVQHVLGMDSAEQVVAMATHLGIEIEYESDTLVGIKIHRNATINEDKPLVTPFSTTIVEAKRGSYTSADVVDGRASGASAPLPSTSISVGRPAATVPSNQSFAKSISLWAEGSLLEKLADHVEELLLHFRPADLDRLVVLYSGAPGRHVASSWLRVKFGFKPSAPSGGNEGQGDRDVLEVDLADGSQLELADLTPSSDGSDVAPESVLQADEYSQPGLVIFETSPAAAQAKTADERRKALASDRKRLEKIASSKLIRGSHLACRLLVVTWGDSKEGGTDDVEMPDADVEVAGSAQHQDLLNSLGVNSTGPVLPSKVFERVGILQLDDASVSVEDMLAAVLHRTLPDLTANPTLYLNGARRVTLEDVVQDFCDQWGRLSALLFDLLNGLSAAPVLGSEVAGSKVEKLACKGLQILTALANHILRTVLSLSETILEDDNPAEECKIELPLPSSANSGLVDMALSQLDELPEEAEEQRLHLRSQLLSSLRAQGSDASELQHVLTVVNRQYIEQLFRLSLSKLSEVWIGVRQDAEAEWSEAKEMFGRLCSAAAEEVAAETRTIWAEYRASKNGSIDMEKEHVSPSKRIRTGSDVAQESVSPASEPAKTKKVNDLRELIARTKRFLDSPAS
ncbi:hypothetical protein NDA16_003484 [Ustilago loliicola]|nr:hypothetical protein NDA16_003484 [Ustilago loliicola]